MQTEGGRGVSQLSPGFSKHSLSFNSILKKKGARDALFLKRHLFLFQWQLHQHNSLSPKVRSHMSSWVSLNV